MSLNFVNNYNELNEHVRIFQFFESCMDESYIYSDKWQWCER